MTVQNHLQQYPTLLTIKEVAGVLQCSDKTIRRMIKEGAVPGVIRIGKAVRINGEILLKYIKEQSRK